VLAVILAEYVWLYSPFDSGTPLVSQDLPSGSTADSAVDSTQESPAPAAYLTLGTLVIRQEPSASGAELGRIPKGTSIVITCVTAGDPVKGATKTDSHWDKVTVGSVTGYVSNTLVMTGTAVDDPSRIPAC
jgi:uncharacterized protein YgiM (DUF1202 family)